MKLRMNFVVCLGFFWILITKNNGDKWISIHGLIIGITLLSFWEHLFYRFTVVNLLSTIGGTMGLFTGFSILSGAEIIYWIFGTIASLLCYRYTILDIRDYILPALLQVYYNGYLGIQPPCFATGILYRYWIFRTMTSLLCYRYSTLDIWDYIPPALVLVSYTGYLGL